MCTCIDWCAGAPAWYESLLPFKLIWGGCIYLSVSIRFWGRALIHSEELPGNAMFYLRSTVSTGLSCLSVGASYALFIELSSLHLRKRGTLGRDYPPHGTCTSQLLVSLGGCQLNMTQVAKIVDCVPPQLWPESSSVVIGKEGEQWYTLLPRGLASWIKMVLWTRQATEPHAHPMVLG